MLPIQISVAQSPSDIAAVQTLWREYWDSLGLTDEFQGFAEELRTLPGKYAAPGGVLLIAHDSGAAVGTVALRQLTNTACEAKRLYVPPQQRGKGIGKALLQRLLEDARSGGYRDMFCDTLPKLTEARNLYQSFGFQPTIAYTDQPTPGVLYFRCSLTP